MSPGVCPLLLTNKGSFFLLSFGLFTDQKNPLVYPIFLPAFLSSHISSYTNFPFRYFFTLFLYFSLVLDGSREDSHIHRCALGLRKKGRVQGGDRLPFITHRQLGEGNQEVAGRQAEGPLCAVQCWYR